MQKIDYFVPILGHFLALIGPFKASFPHQMQNIK